jgi:hypothetical protein
MIRYISPICLLLLPGTLHAQMPVGITPDETVAIFSGPHFFAAMVAGLILAIAFQLVLTTLSVAAGVSAVGPITEKEPRRPGDKETSGVTGTVRKINNAFGVWALVTASIALFFASWLAVALSLTASMLVGAVLGLVIWGLFYIAMMTLEATALSSLVGALIRAASTGLRSVYDATTSLVAGSPEKRMAESAAEVAGAVREELFGDLGADEIRDELQKYVSQLKPPSIDPAQIRREISKLLDQTEIEAVSTTEGPFFERERILATLQTRSGLNADQARTIIDNVEQAMAVFREEKTTGKGKISTLADTSLRMAGLSPEEAEDFRKRFENYLRRTGKQELSPEGIKRDLERLASDPKGGMAALRERLSQIDRETVLALLSQRKDVNQEEAQRIMDRIEQVIGTLTGGVQAAREAGEKRAAEPSMLQAARDSALRKVEDYLNSLQRPELRYEGIRHDVQRLFHDPRAGADALMRRLRSMDRDTIKAILASRRDISEEDAEQMLQRIETARDDAMHKAERMKQEIERRLEETRREALELAEESRKAAATAAWWATATTVVSGLAAMLGGIMAVTTGV